MSGEHAFLAPSAAGMWGPGGCSAYPRMAAAYATDEETPESREGEAYHHYIAETLRSRACGIGDLAPNGHPITAEMVDCAADALADARGWIAAGAKWAVEQRLTMPTIHPTQNWGTSDLIGCNHTTRTLYIRDNKYGHAYVDAYENWQCVDYGEGAARFFGITLDASWTVDIGIFQPRCFHPDGPRKIWRVDGARFQELADSLAHAARKAMEPDAPMTTGEHCDYCPARHACVALYRAGAKGMDVSMRSIPHDLSPDATGIVRTHIARAIQRLEALASGLDAQIMAMALAGKRVAGWETWQGDGRDVWTAPMEEVYALGDLYGIELRVKSAPTPKQAIAKGIDATVIMEYSKTPKGKLKVVPVDDNRAARAFK